MKKISNHISYKEATNSQTALRENLDNKPKSEHIKNIRKQIINGNNIFISFSKSFNF